MLITVDNAGLHILEWRQISRFLRINIGGIQTPVFIALNILNVHDVLVIRSPEIKAHTTISILSDRLIIATTDSTHPDIEDVIHRGNVGHPFAIRRDLRTGFYRVAKQYAARNEFNCWGTSHHVSPVQKFLVSRKQPPLQPPSRIPLV